METLARFLTFLFVSSSSFCWCDLLLLPPGGYARIFGIEKEPLDTFTLSAWVNTSHFSEGVTPIITYLNENATSQVSFFLRENSVGVLWGGPKATEVITDLRRPRTFPGANRRSRRNAADYSGGLGDIENILGGRSGRQNNQWSPVNLIDVGVFGVDDLMTSGSQQIRRSGLPDTRYETSRMDPYPGWTNVPYELHMQESAKIDSSGKTEPRIITESDGDDYVYINFNNPTPNKLADKKGGKFPQWKQTDNEDTFAKDTLSSSPAEEPLVDSVPNRGSWSTKVEQMTLSDSWNPMNNIPGVQEPSVEIPAWVYNTNFDKQKLDPFSQTSIKTEHKQYSKESPQASATPIVFVNTQKPPQTQSAQSFRYTFATKAPSATTRRPVQTTRAPVATTKRPTPIPTTTRNSVTTKKYPAERSRTPLWMLIKKPEKTASQNAAPTAHKKTPNVRKPAPHKLKEAETRSPSTLHSKYQQLNSKKKPAWQTADTTTAKYKQDTKKTHRYSHHNLRKTIPLSPTRKHTNVNSRWPITTLRPAVLPTVHTTPRIERVKQPNHYSKHSYSLVNKYKQASSFEKAMKSPVTYKEGAKAVVYAFPIQNEKEFYKLYEKYQDDAKTKYGNNLQQLYEDMRLGQVPEEETNENKLQEAIPQFSQPISITPRATEKPHIKPINHPETDDTPFIPIGKPIQTHNTYRPAIPTPIKISKVPQPETIEKETVSVPIPDEYYEYYAYGDDADEYEYPLAKEVMLTSSNSNAHEKFIPEQHFTEDDLYALTNFYKPKHTTLQHIVPQQSNYQEPLSINHQQLPPSYEKVTKNEPQFDQSESPKENVDASNGDDQSAEMYSSNRDSIIAQGLLPRPVHMVNTQEEAQRWITDQEYSFVATPSDSSNPPTPVVTATQVDKSKPTLILGNEDKPLDIQIKEVPYNFHTNEWYHIAYTWSKASKTLRIFINGEQISEIDTTLSDVSQMRKHGVYMIGRTLLPDLSDFDESSQFQGELSGVNIWTEEYSPQEVDNLFQCKQAPSPAQALVWNQTPMAFYNNARLIQSPRLCGVIT